jgi:hypothetical protein
MENQHQHIDTASDLRDLIAVTPAEETPIPAAPETRYTEVLIDKQTFREMRLQLLSYRTDIRYFMNSVVTEEEKDRTVAKLTEILDKASWDKVKFVN